MKAATQPNQRPAKARLLHIDGGGALSHRRRGEFVDLIQTGDVIVANDAATMPASLPAIHERSGAVMELRLAGRSSLEPQDMQRLIAIAFGRGDYRTRTEERALPPALEPGDRLKIGTANVVIEAVLGHPRCVRLRFDADPTDVWRTLALAGAPIQYAHMQQPLALWDVWTRFAADPIAFEAPSAGFAFDWQLLTVLRARGAQFVTLTHAAGISSTGDQALDARLPFDEPYRIPASTVHAIAAARARGRRVIAVGTTVVRALEHAACSDGTLRAGAGVATQRIGRATTLRIVDALLSGTHEAGSSHYELLRAFQSDDVLTHATAELESAGYLTHEFGDSLLVEADARRMLRTLEHGEPAGWSNLRKTAACTGCLA